MPVRCCCAPSCRARSIRRRSSSPAATRRAATRAARPAGPSAGRRARGSRCTRRGPRRPRPDHLPGRAAPQALEAGRASSGGAMCRAGRRAERWPVRREQPVGEGADGLRDVQQRRAERGGPCGVGGLHGGKAHGHDRGDHHRTDDGARERLARGEPTHGQDGDGDHRHEDRDARPQLDELERCRALEDRERVRRSPEFPGYVRGGSRKRRRPALRIRKAETERPSPPDRTGRERQPGRSAPGAQGRRRSSPRRQSRGPTRVRTPSVRSCRATRGSGENEDRPGPGRRPALPGDPPATRKSRASDVSITRNSPAHPPKPRRSA